MDRKSIPFTNEHFAAFCEKMLGQPYWMGTCLYKCTESLRSRKAEQYPSHYGTSRTTRYKQDIAAMKVCADCIGGIKGYAWTGGGIGVLESIGTDKPIPSKYGSNGCPDKGANSMFTYAKQKGMDWGVIGTLPEIVGLALHKDGHVGIYVGDGYAVEWRGYADGCIKTKVAGRGWTHWYRLTFIQYGPALPPTPDAPTDPSVRELSYIPGKAMPDGEDVRALQLDLNALGYACGMADGIFGPKTSAAAKVFQKDHGLEVDGIVGKWTRAALEEALKVSDRQDGGKDSQAQAPSDECDEGQAPDGGEEAWEVDVPSEDVMPVVTIRMRMTRPANIAAYGAGEVHMDIEEYLRGVVPAEMYESADLEALKAQAICARTYACRRLAIILSDTATHQAFDASKIGTCPRSDEAIRTTKGQVLVHDGKVIDCFYSVSNKGMTERSGDVWRTHYPYYVSKRDEWDEAARAEKNISVSGHGVGLSQHGAMWAAKHGVGYKSILAFYYECGVIADAYNT